MARILILQEEPSWQAALRGCLEAKHDLLVVESRKIAIAALHNERFDLIIARVHLKGDDVFQFLRELKSDATLAPIPVICFCGLRSRMANLTRASVETASLTMGADAYLAIEDFCLGEWCDLERMRTAIEVFSDRARRA